MKIDIYSTLRKGGPYTWCKQLSEGLNEIGYETRLHNTLTGLVTEPIPKQIAHSVLPFIRPLRGKYILTIHGDYKIEKNIWTNLYPMAIKQADVVTTPSNYLKSKLGLKDAMVIPNGICKPKEIKRSYGLIQKEPSLGTITNFNIRKKAEGLIDLARICKEISPKIKLYIAGDGTYKNKFEFKLKDIHPESTFIGHVNKEELFSISDIFCYYSHLDNQPLAVMEAMAYGLPVISNDIGGVAEVLEQKSYITVYRDSDSYKEALSDLLKSRAKRKRLGKALRIKSEDYQWSNIIKRWTNLYESLTDN